MASTRRGLSAELFCIISMISSRQFLHLTHAFSRSSSSRPFHGEFCPNRASVSRLTELAFVLVRLYQGFQLFLTELPFAVVRLYQGFQPFYWQIKKTDQWKPLKCLFLNVILSASDFVMSARIKGFSRFLSVSHFCTSACSKAFSRFISEHPLVQQVTSFGCH